MSAVQDVAKQLQAEIAEELQMDENQVPERLSWEASDGGSKGDVKAMMLSVWDEKTRLTNSPVSTIKSLVDIVILPSVRSSAD